MSAAFHISLGLPCGSHLPSIATCPPRKRSCKHPVFWLRRGAPRCSLDPSGNASASPNLQAEDDIDTSDSKWSGLSASLFDEKLASRKLALCIVGMSNCGKSYWSTQLHMKRSFSMISVDSYIESELDQVLKADGHVGMEGLAEWMGFPSDERFATNQVTYLAAEEKITANVSPISGNNSVVDTTGSVVYLSRATRKHLVQNYLVVHIEAENHMLQLMTDNYFKTPKPVVWGSIYNPLPGESPDQALRRCYPNLLRQRRELYARMAHVSIPASFCLDRSLKIDAFLDAIRTRLS